MEAAPPLASPVTPLPPAIRRLSRTLSTACLILIVALPLVVVAYWTWADPAQLATQAHLGPQAIQTPPTEWQRLAGALLTGFALSFLLAALWQAHKGFALFAAGQHFSAEAVHRLKRFAGWILVAEIAALAVRTALSVLLTIDNPPGSRMLAIGISSEDLFSLFGAGVVWVMAAVIAQGHSLAEENAGYV